MKLFLSAIIMFLFAGASGQSLTPEYYGFRHLQTVYQKDTVDILIKSKKGEEQQSKPILLFCQGSLPIPLIVQYEEGDKKGIYPVFVFDTDSLVSDYHLVIIGKPHVPLIAEQKSLDSNLSFTEGAAFPAAYVQRNLLDYYTKRNIQILKFLRKQSWVSKKRLVVAGHSEGSAVAAKIAFEYAQVTDLIYSGGNPLGRFLTLVSRTRAGEKESSAATEAVFQYWQNVVDTPDSMALTGGDTFKAMYQFSSPPPINYLKRLKIPVLVTYGTKDYGAISAIDYLQLETIRLKKSNFTFKGYFGTEHNFFPVKDNGETDFETFNWNKVANDWRNWLKRE